MVFWGKKKAGDGDKERLLSNYMLIYTSSYREFFTTLEFSRYPIAGIDKNTVMEIHDELFALLLLTIHRGKNIEPATFKLISYLVGSRVGVELSLTSSEQQRQYLATFEKRLDDDIKLLDDGYALESLPIILLGSRAAVDSAAIKERVPFITASLRKYIKDLSDSIDNPDAILAAANSINQS